MMRVARVRHNGVEDFAVSSGEDGWSLLRGLGIHAADTAEVIAQAAEIERALGAGGAPTVGAEVVELLCPVVRPGKMLAIGLNYADHAKETGAAVPEEPIVFAKYTNALSGPTDPIEWIPELTKELDYESELAVIIGRAGRFISEADALDHVFGYAVANDVSARDLQRTDAQFSRSKSFDTFCPIGPWITTADEVPDPQGLRIGSSVNGEIRQQSTTDQMIFDVRGLIAYLSQTATLAPGDVILTGTPPGVGLGFKPPRFLTDGDIVECEIDGLGRLSNTVVRATYGG